MELEVADKNAPQPRKLFFLPRVICVFPNGQGYPLLYARDEASEPSTQSAWAGRILPGQTINEGVAREVQQELGYVGRLSVELREFESFIKDKRGHDIARFNADILLYDPVQNISIHGLKLSLGKPVVQIGKASVDPETLEATVPVTPVHFFHPDAKTQE